jgi:hypothetical protein
MATVYVDTDNYLDLVAYGAGDTITVRYGAILTIRDSNTTQPFQITTTDSVIKVATEQRKLVLNAAGYVNCVAGDIGKTVVGADTGDTGTLVDYNNATRIWHVLRDDPTDDQFDDVNEAISITGGTGAGTMNGAAAQSIIVKFNATVNSGIVVSGNGKLMTRGDWYPLGVGNGGAGQTFAFYGAEACPYVRVETGNGTGIFTDCRCVYNTLLTTYGAGVYMGNVFQHAPDAGAPIANLTFGDGVNGLKPANGARVQCPDIFITSAAAYNATYTSRSRVSYATAGGEHDWQNVIFSDRFTYVLGAFNYFYLSYVGVFARVTMSGCPDVVASHVVFSKDRVQSNNYAFTWYYFTGTLDHFNAETYGSDAATQSAAGYIQYGYDIEITDSQFVETQRSGAAAYSNTFALFVNYSINVTIDEVTIIGAELCFNNCYSPLRIDGVRYSDSPSGAKPTGNVVPAVYMVLCGKFFLTDVTLLSGGSAPYRSGVIVSSATAGGVIKEFAWDMDTRTTYLAEVDGLSNDIILANCDMTGTPRTGHVLINYVTTGVCARNLKFAAAMTNTVAGSKERVEGLVSGTMAVAQNTVFDTMFQMIYDSAAKLTGYICLIMTPPNELSYYTRLAGDPAKSIRFSNTGSLFMNSIGDSCTYEIPYLIQGVSSFRNIAATILHATWDANCTKEYAIKSGAYGSSWGAWTTVTGAHLAAEAVDSTVGFYMKFRFTMTGAHATNNYCSRFMIPVNTDPAFVFPVGYVPVTLRGMVSGSQYWVYDNTNSRVIGQGVAAGVDVTIDAPYEFDFSDVSITVRVRKGSAATKYLPWEQTLTYDENGAIVYVAQVPDTIAA